jgi:RNA polymerase sigma factor (sigma-70 family)
VNLSDGIGQDLGVMTRSDADQVTASVHEPSAFGAVFDRHARVVHAYLARRLGPDRAEDATAETFRIAFERRATFDAGRGEVRPWLLGIATNLVRRDARDEERRLRALGRLAAADGEPGVAGPSLPASPAVGAALAALEPRDRDVVLLIAWEDLAYEQVAAALDIPVGTVRSRLHRARQQLRAALAEHLAEEDRHG